MQPTLGHSKNFPMGHLLLYSADVLTMMMMMMMSCRKDAVIDTYDQVL